MPDRAVHERARLSSTIVSGKTHTKWWSHEIGEATSMPAAARQAPSSTRPARHHSAPMTITASVNAPATANQTRVLGSSPSSRVIAPSTDWFPA